MSTSKTSLGRTKSTRTFVVMAIACLWYLNGWTPGASASRKAADIVTNRRADGRLASDSEPHQFKYFVWYKVDSGGVERDEVGDRIAASLARTYQDQALAVPPREERLEGFEQRLCEPGECDAVKISVKKDGGSLSVKIMWHDGSIPYGRADKSHEPIQPLGCPVPEADHDITRICEDQVVEEICVEVTKHTAQHLQASAPLHYPFCKKAGNKP